MFETPEIWHNDCFDVLPILPARSIDLVVCDLPYGTTRCKWDTTLPLDKLWGQYTRLCKGAVILFAQTPFDKVLGCSNLEDLRYEWVWEKPAATGQLNANRAPLKAHENILVFYRRQPTYNPIKTSGHVRKTVRRKLDTSELYGAQRESSYDSTDRYPRSVLCFSSDKQKLALHPTQKPLALIDYLVRTYSNPGDVVLDNCLGSGTTGVAALQSGRRFVGIEKDDKYAAIAFERIKAVAPNVKMRRSLW
jgi:DNA modification methylase